MKQAVYKCLQCQHKWKDRPGPKSTYWTNKGIDEGNPEKYADFFCPNCGSLYAKWENYKLFSNVWEEYNRSKRYPN
jgi:DNA-directed RNA polymerase subunit RPC12/RpoP